MGIFKKLFRSTGGSIRPDETVLSEADRAQLRRHLESTIGELKRFDDGMTVEAMATLEERGLQATYDELWERLIALHKAADTETAEKLKQEAGKLLSDIEAFFHRLDKLGIWKHIYIITNPWMR